jgi:hypothetical protein
MSTLTLKAQEIALDDPQSNYMFWPSSGKPFLATPAAISAFGTETIVQCLGVLQTQARRQKGLDYLQVFEDPTSKKRLWFIEDGPGGAITALLPSDY